MEKATKKLAVIILNYNGRKHLEQYLPSVVRYSNGHELIVADNASTDDSVVFLQEHFPQIRIIQNAINGGFAEGYNAALKQVEAEYYLLLNSDVEVTANWIEPLLAFLEANPKAAGCQPKVLSHREPGKFEHAGASGGFLDQDYYPFCRGRIFDQIEEDHGQYDDNREVFWSTGACMLIRAELYHKVGGLDSEFFAHMEEIDLCWRLKRLGFSFHVIGSSLVYHLGGGTLAYMSPKKTFLNFRNSLFMITKNHEGFLVLKLFKRMVLDGLATLRFIRSGQWKHILALLQAHFSFYSHLNLMLKKRKEFKCKFSSSIQFNKVGIYRKSIITDRFLSGKTKFSELNQKDFF